MEEIQDSPDYLDAALVVFAFGPTQGSMANALLGRQASAIAKRYNMPVLAHPVIAIEPTVRQVTRTDEKAGESWPTLRVARAAVEWSKTQGTVDRRIQKLVVLANPWNTTRAARDLMEATLEAKAGLTIVETSFPESVVGPRPPRSQWLDKKSFVPTRRFKFVLSFYELFLIMLPFGLYKKIAS